MSAKGGVTAVELVRALRRRRSALPAEIGTFIVFEACEAMLSRGPAVPTLTSTFISEDGIVSLPDAAPTDEESAARGLHGMLTSLLVVAGRAPTPALLQLVEGGPSGGRFSLSQMRDDLEAALVPLNRTASRRVLSRLVRELGFGDRVSGRPLAVPSFNELDRELNSLLGLAAPTEPEPSSVPEERVSEREPERGLGADDTTETFDEMQATARRPDLDGLTERPSAGNRSGLFLGALLVLLALGLVAAILVLRPDAVARLRGVESADHKLDQPPELAPAKKAPTAFDLVIHVAEERAQVLRFVGLGPATVEHLPLGVAHEFVAMADGALPTRVLVPADAEWETTEQGPRYEVAMQAGAQEAEGAELDLGNTLLPRDVGAPQSKLGAVRIVTTPRGAKVYQVIGFAPEVRLENLPLDASEELLIWKKGYRPVTRKVGASDLAEQDGRMIARVDITLERLPKR
jgi:hypothetical protein